ncbi:MAG: ATP-binding protein [Hamadaea sp.]|nr:ATP-binding protein [Hamadaea sp.]
MPDASGGIDQPGRKLVAGDPSETLLDFRAGDLHRVRQTVSAYAHEWGVPGDRAGTLLLVASELAVNAVRHGGGIGRLRLWRDSTGVVCEVADRGPGLADPEQAGRTAPGPRQSGGRGLWILRTVADDLLVVSGPDGTTVTAWVSVSWRL